MTVSGNPGSCKASSACSVNKIWMQAREQLRETLGRVTFAQLVEEGPCVPFAQNSRITEVE